MKYLDVIQCRSDVGIIADQVGNKFLIMFETVSGVEFRWYQMTFVWKNYRVVG